MAQAVWPATGGVRTANRHAVFAVQAPPDCGNAPAGKLTAFDAQQCRALWSTDGVNCGEQLLAHGSLVVVIHEGGARAFR